MDEKTRKLAEALEKHCRFTTRPVAVKLAKQGETPPEKTKYPVRDLGNRLAVCQGMSIARTFEWTMAFRDEDHACPLPRIFMGHRKPDTFLDGRLGEFYQDDIKYMQEMEASYPRWALNTYQEVWLSPVNRCRFVPDLVVAYGTPAQVLTLIQAANFRRGPGIEAVSTGRYGCSAWLAGALQAGECTYMVPGPGERVFAGTQDHEMSFAIPYSRFDNLVDGLQYVRSRGSFRYPVPNLGLLFEPRIPEKYHEAVGIIFSLFRRALPQKHIKPEIKALSICTWASINPGVSRPSSPSTTVSACKGESDTAVITPFSIPTWQ